MADKRCQFTPAINHCHCSKVTEKHVSVDFGQTKCLCIADTILRLLPNLNHANGYLQPNALLIFEVEVELGVGINQNQSGDYNYKYYDVFDFWHFSYLTNKF